MISGDRSNRGHILGKANAIASETGRDGLSPAAVYVMRMIMHSAMLAGTCKHPEVQLLLFKMHGRKGRVVGLRNKKFGLGISSLMVLKVV